MTARPFACQPAPWTSRERRLADDWRPAHVIGMTGEDKAKDREREERLAAALRDNLRRRKAQARALSDAKQTDSDQ